MDLEAKKAPEVIQALDRIQGAFRSYGNDTLPYERLEAIVDRVAREVATALGVDDIMKDLVDDGDMPLELQELKALLREFEGDMRRP